MSMTPERRARAEKVREMRLSGRTFEQAANELGISKTRAHDDYHALMAELRGQTARDFLTEALQAYRHLSRRAIQVALNDPNLANIQTVSKVLENALKAHGVWDLTPSFPLEVEAGQPFADLIDSIRTTFDEDDEGEV